jgi:hypothetical protein
VRKKVIVNLGGKGDIVNTTMLPKLYKEHGYDQVVWITFRKNMSILENNPYIDRIVPVEDISDNSFVQQSNHVFATAVLKKQMEESGYDCVFPAPYSSPIYTGNTEVALLELIRKTVSSEFNLSTEDAAKCLPQIFLSENEVEEARSFFKTLPTDKKIVLVEHETLSNQTFVNTENLLDVTKSLSNKFPELFFVFTGFRKINETHAVSYNGSFKSNVELYNLCQGFISVASGVTCLIHSDYCPDDKLTLEIVRGRHWSSADYLHKKNKLFVTHPNDIVKAADIFARRLCER